MIPPLRVIVCEANWLSREGIKSIINQLGDPVCKVVGESEECSILEPMIRRQKPDLLFIDEIAVNHKGFGFLNKLQHVQKKLGIIILSWNAEDDMVELALSYGAKGIFDRGMTPDKFCEGVKKVADGKTFVINELASSSPFYNNGSIKKNYKTELFLKSYPLTKRELQILRLVAQALSNKEIAQQLYISDQTVSVHRKNIMRKLKVSNSAGIIKMAYENGII